MSNNMNAVQITDTQTSKEAAINTMFGKLDAAITERLDIVLSSVLGDGSDYKPTLNQWREYLVYRIREEDVAYPTGASTNTLTVTTGAVRLFIVHNDNVGTIQVRTEGSPGTVIDVGPNSSTLFYVNGDGLTNISGGSGGAAATDYDVGSFFGGNPAANATLLSHIAGRAFELPINLVGSQSDTAVNPAAAVTFDLKKNGASAFGTLTVTTSGVGTFTSAVVTSFAIGDILTVVAQGTTDATVADISLTLVGTKT